MFRGRLRRSLGRKVGSASLVLTRTYRVEEYLDVVIPHLGIAYPLLLLSLLAHEFGHTAACTRFGARPAEIGIGIYFVYPALYSDVTDACRLTRWQRVVVDCGGVYFQAVVGALFVWGHVLTGWPPLLAAAVLVVANCLFSLNPLFKFDGYWMIADTLGTTNLARDAREIADTLWRRLRGRTTRALRCSLPFAAAILCGGALAALVWAAFMVRVLPGIVRRLLEYPVLVERFVREISTAAPGTGARTLFNFLLTTLFVVLAGRMLVSLAVAGWGHARKLPALLVALRARLRA